MLREFPLDVEQVTLPGVVFQMLGQTGEINHRSVP
jgi:hypothetical protein